MQLRWVVGMLVVSVAVVAGAMAQQDRPDDEIRFNFKGATFEQVIDFFSRQTGLPVVWETPPPEGTLDYLSPESYDRAEALRILNIVLQSKGVMLRVSDDMLYLQKLTEMRREDIPTFVGEIPDDVTPDQVITVVRPLDIALAEPLAGKLQELVAEYGSVTALEQQNSLVITETAAQVRRLLQIVTELDREDPEGAIEIFSIRHTTATALMVPLQALMSHKVEKYVVNQEGQQVKIEEESLPGLSITADERTNSIIAKGVQSRIDKLRETIELLDVPAITTGRTIRTITLAMLSPQQAADRLNQVYGRLAEDERPTVIALDELGAVTIVGDDEAIAEGAALLREIDGADETVRTGARSITAVALRHADPEAVISALISLLNGRQAVATKIVAGPDGRSIVISGTAADVAAVEAVLPAIDRAPRVDREARLLRLSAGDPAGLIAQALALYERQIDPDDAALAVSVDVDGAARTATIVGSAAAQERFARTLQLVESATVVERETRQIQLTSARPDRVASPMATVARQLLTPHDGTEFVEPVITPVNELDLIVVTALPEQFGVLESLVATLDRPDPADYQFRVIPLAGVDRPEALVERADDAFALIARGHGPDEIAAPETRIDTLTGNLIVSGDTEAVGLYERAVAEARRLLPPARSGRLLPLRQASAADVAVPLRALMATTIPVDAGRVVPAPEIEVIERTNSLYVVAEPAQHALVERFVAQLDTYEPTTLPPLKLLQVRAADATQLAAMLRQRYDARSAQARREEPVEIDADAGTNTLIVTAHEAVFDDIRALVESINRAGESGAERETMIFPLKRARAVDLATALGQLYPEPPVPLDRRGRPLPHLREPREVHVSADAATNTLIVEAPTERRPSFEALVDQLDRIELPPSAELRTYRIERGDPARIVTTLNELATRGVLSAPNPDGGHAVQVTIQAEPESRTLIVAGDQVTFEKVEQVLEDLEAVPVRRELRVFEVFGTDPVTMMDRALALYAEQTAGVPDAGEVSVEIDRTASTLFVVADAEAMLRFASILDQLQESIGPAPDVRLTALEFADAAEVVDFLRGLAESELAAVAAGASFRPEFHAIERTNSVLVAARSEQHDVIRALIVSLDRPEERPMPPLRILQLRAADAVNLAAALMRQYDQRPNEERREKPVQISADPQTNALIVAAHPDVVPELQAIVEELNRTGRMDAEGREIRIFPLKVARAEELARSIDEMFPQPPMPRDRRGNPMPHLQQPREVVVRADPQTNSLIVDAPIQRMAGFETLVEQLDRQRIADETEVRTFGIVHGDLDAIAATLNELSTAGTLSPAGHDRRVPVTITTEPVSRTLIVSGPTDIFERVEQVLGELDARRAGPRTALRFFRLQHARSESVAPMLREILLTRIDEDVPEAGPDATALLNVTSDAKTNTLIISAPAALMPVAEELVRQLDDTTASIGDPVIRVRPLTFADASDIAGALGQALPQMISALTGEPIDVRLIATPGSNAIIMVGLDQDLDEVETLIEPLDARPATDAVDVRTFALEHTDAAELAPIVTNLLTDQQDSDPRIIMERIRRSRGQVDLSPKIRVEAHDRTNSLIISGPPQTLALAEALLERLDAADAGGRRTYRTFTPETADARRLAELATEVLRASRSGAGRSTLELFPETRSGAVVVVGTEAEVDEAIELLRLWDDRAIRMPEMDLRVLAIDHSDAVVVGGVVEAMLRDRTRWPQQLQAAVRAGVPIGEPTVTGDPAGGRLLVSAPAVLIPLARQLVAELDTPPGAAGTVDVRVFNLQRADAGDVAEAVRTAMAGTARPGGRPVGVAAEPSSNSIVVTAAPADLAAVESLVAELDQGVGADQPQVRSIFLRHARAEVVAPLVEQLLAGEDVPVWMRMEAVRRGAGGLMEPGPDVRVAADPRLNAVVISAPPATLNVAEQMVTQLDVDPESLEGAASRSVRVLVIENADPVELAANVEALFDQEAGTEQPPTVRVDRGSGAMIIRATDGQFRTIEQVVREIDRATITFSRQIRLIPIDPGKAPARDVARTIERLLDRGGSGRVEVITVEQLLEEHAPERVTDPAPGSSSRAPTSLPAILASVVIGLPQEDDGAPDTGERTVTIAVDEETNSLIVVGSPRAIERIAELASEIQDQLPAEAGTIRYIELPETVDAQALARLVTDTIGRLTPAGERPGAMRGRVAVLPDVAGSALIVASNDRDFRTIGQLVAALARPPATEKVVVKVYPLTTITAERAAAGIRDLVTPATSGPRRPARGRQARRIRDLALTLISGDRTIEAVFDPARMRVASDAASNSLIVMGPADAIAFVDQFVDLVDRAPESTPSTLKLYPLRHARAPELRATLRDLFRSRFRSLQGRGGVAGEIMPEFAADERTNTLLVTASPEQLAEVDGLLEQLDQAPGDALNPLRMIEVTAAQPSQVASILEQVVIASDQERRASTLIIPDDQSGMLLVRAGEAVMPEIDAVLERIDRHAAQGFEVRTITLERADAGSVADALQRFFDDRARIASEGRGRRAQSRRVSIVGDTASATLLIAASDEDYAEIERLVEQFDTAEAVGALSFRVFLLEHSKVDDVESTVQDLVNDLMWNQGSNVFFFGQFSRSRSRSGDRRQGSLAIRGDRRLNALIVTGEGDKFDVVEQLIDVLDAPSPEGAQRVVRLYRLRHADLGVVEQVVREVFASDTGRRRWWEPENPNEIKVRSDDRSNTLIVSGTVREHEEIAELIASIDSQVAPPDQQVVVLPVRFGAADELARTLEQFLADRAEATNAPEPSATIVSSDTANALVVSAAGEDLATIRDLLGQLDRADVSGERVVEIIVLREGDADEVARIIKAQFPRGRDSGVIVTPDLRTNSVIVNAPADTYARVEALIRQLDTPPAGDETIIRTYALAAARATDAVKILAESLQLDEQGETTGITIRLEESDAEAVEVRARITADRRSNSLIVTATEESFPVIETLIRRIDDVPTVSPVEYRIIPLEHALAIDVAFTLRQFTRQRLDDEGPEPKVDYNRLENHLIIAATAAQFELISQIVDQIDQPSTRARITDFVPLQFAEAEKVQEALSVFYGPLAIEADTPGKINARIVADPATNSLVISADEGEWADIRELLDKLDNEEYDASLQLRVLPLSYADARSVARAINEAFQGSLERQRRPEMQQQPQSGGDGDGQRREPVVPTLLVEAEEWVRASAEPQTNSVIVSASRQTIRKIEGIVEQLDVADYAKLPPPQIIPVTTGDPVRLAEALNNLYRQEDEGRGRMAMRIVPDAASNTIIVRAEEEEYRQILALAQAIQQEAASQGVSVHVLQLASAPAGRIAAAIRDAFAEKAEQTGQPLSIQVDVTGNSLVIASTAPLFEEIRATAAELDRLSPGVGQAVFIIELEHVSPDEAQWIIETIGLEDEAPPDSSSRLVSEPIKVSVVPGRRALVVVANPADRETVVGILKAIDVVPLHAGAHTRIVRLRHARADALARILAEVLDPASQQSTSALARAVQEQVRRLAVRRDGLDEMDLQLDLTQPVRVIADGGLNALVVSSTEANVVAIEALIGIFDQLPITEAVTVQLFPLENIAAEQFERIVNELFSQGKALGRVPGTDLEGVPGGTVGRALLDEIAIAVDERTNTVVVAGKEEAVALVEVLSQRIDTDVASGWVEPRILPLKFADASDLAETLEAILIDGQSDLPQSTPLQRQVARLRMARVRENGGAVLESDIFQPLSRLVIRAEPQLNALILVGTPINLELVSELVVMLDVEAASPSAIVRIYPVEHASASRLADTITRLFDQQVESKAIRPEDRVIVQPDERTNALIVTTSPRSFTVLEHLLAMLDAEIAPDLRAIRRISLENSSATRIANLIQTLMDARLERLRRVQPETADLERATIVADPRTNSLVIAAGNESFEVIERLAADLDNATLTDTSLLEVISVDEGNVERIAETINLIMDRRYADVPGELRNVQKPLVLTDPRSSSLLVAANPEDLNAIRDLVSKLAATPSHPALALRLIPLTEPARAEAYAPRLQRLMRERQQSLGEAGTSIDRVSIEADPVSNSLIVAASEENIEIIGELIKVLNAAEAGGDDREVEVLTLTQSRATDVVDLLEDLYVAETNRVRGANTVRVTPDERLNAVLVNAPAADVRAIRGLVAQLDGARPSSVVEIKYLSLTSANALETVSLIENVLSGRGIGARRGSRQATVLKYLRRIAGEVVDGEEPVDDEDMVLDEVQVSAAIREAITLTPDLRTNTIIVSAPAESMGMIEQMIRDLDSSSTGAKRVRIFKLENADAAAMAEILTELFNLRRGNSLYVLRPREDGLPGGVPVAAPDAAAPGAMPTVGLSGTELTAVPDERQQLSITIDSRTNSLLVSGTPTYLDLVANVVEELDALDANERETLVYPLNNADALEVAAVITGFIEEEQSKLVETLSLDQIGSASRLLEREVTIVGDQKSNTVLVSASPRYMSTVQQLIRELDIDPPQVLIQVLLAEVTLDDAVDWGVDMDFSLGVGGAAVGGGFGLASVFATPAGVPNFTVTSTDFNLLINALEAQGRLQILSNPSVIAANNQPARIQIGSEIRVADITTISDGGNQSTTVVPQEIGIIVDVTPAINPDGFVRMLIQPEISELSSETTQITEDLETPVITKRNADTTVTVRDGQTVVIGGLINDRYEFRNAKVPFFGDLPLVGPLFRAERQTTRKTEFLIVVTPYVLETPAALDDVTDGEIDRLSLPESVKDQIRRGRLEGTVYDADGNPIWRDDREDDGE